MTHLLDTSAIIGWLERNDSSLPSIIASGNTALYHPVTLGELNAGIERATTEPERLVRSNTLKFTLQRLQVVEDDVLPAEHFGFLTAQFSRKLSHNDYWIVAAAIAAGGLTLLTEDRTLFEVVTSSPFIDALAQRAWLPPTCVLVESKPVLP